MAENIVKLTVRLPAPLHHALKERAVEYNVSLNQAVIDTLTAELAPEPRVETEVERVDHLLRKRERLADARWLDEFAAGVEIPSLDEMREWFREAPLADWIIEDRGPR
jgi:hypothetical protein